MKFNGRWLIVYTISLIIFINGAYGGIHIANSGGGNGESGSVSLNFDTLKTTAVNSQITIKGATITPSTAIKGPIAIFEETHAVTDTSGKSASVCVKVLNAPKGLTYSSTVLPGEGNVATQSQVSAEQWLTVPKADSIKCTAASSYGTTQSAIVGLEEYKGTLKGDYVTLTGYYGKALTTDTSAFASQTAASGAANLIKIYGSATDSSGTYNVDTSLMGISGGKATFTGLSETSSVGTYTQVEQNEHLHGTFTSTATYTPATGTATTTTRTSNYGTEYDLNMKAAQDSLPTGCLGYYVKRGTTAGKIQDAVNAAQSGDTINVAAGKYAENVNINKILTLKGAGNPTATSFALNAMLGTGSGGITAPIVYVNPNAKIQDGVTLASLKGTVNVAAGTYVENVKIDKSLTVKGAGATQTVVDGNKAGSVFSIGKNNAKAVVTLSGIAIKNGKAEDGGGIYNAGKTTITGCTISGNTAEWNGGGIYNEGIMAITASTISENIGRDGGGIYNEAIATITKNIISGNKAKWDGGGICNGGVVTSGTLSVKGSTISGNTAEWNGGGICNGGVVTSGTLSVTDSTISGNTAEGYGGGIYSNGKLSIGGTSQIINNQATTGYGGAIYSTTDLVSFDGKKVAVKFNKAYSPDILPVETPWYQGWGVYLTTGIPTTKKGFNPATQVTGNTRI